MYMFPVVMLKMVEIIIQMNKNDYIEAYVYTTDTNLQLSHNAATGVLPVVPGINITMFQI